MKVIILGAGYATRLYPLTLNQPKPLLDVAGKPMIEHVLDNLKPITTSTTSTSSPTPASPNISNAGQMTIRPRTKMRQLR